MKTQGVKALNLKCRYDTDKTTETGSLTEVRLLELLPSRSASSEIKHISQFLFTTEKTTTHLDPQSVNRDIWK